MAQIVWRLMAPRSATIAAIAALISMTPGANARQAGQVETVAARDAGEPIMAIVSIKSQQITFYDADGWTVRAPVSTGTTGRETPAGIFSVIEKEREHYSTLYDDASMPHMQRLTWNGIALHGGPLPGYAASHGCVRMPFGFAKKQFDQTQLGMRVIISPDDAAPVPFSHPALLMPNAQAVASAPYRAEALSNEAADAAKAADEAKKAAVKSAREAASAKVTLRRLEGLKKAADANLAYAEKVIAGTKADLTRSQTDGEKAIAAAKNDKIKSRAEDQKAKAATRGQQALARAEEQKSKAAERAIEAGTKLDAGKVDATSKADAATKAADAVKTSATKKTDTAKAADEAKLALEPFSLYVSRATQRVYVRRNTHKPWPDGGVIFDATIEAPITIRDPDKPIGTHIFTAMASSDEGLRWNAVTIENMDGAKEALDRISIPKEVIDRIGPTALPRSSIIVSDEPLSRETNYRTEFVVVLSDQPQGGFITRKPTYTSPPPSKSWEGGGGGFFSFFDGPSPQSVDRRRRGRSYQAQKNWWD